MDQLKKVVEDKYDDMMFLLLIIFIPFISILFTSFILMLLIGNKAYLLELLQTWIAMGTSFIAIPIIMINKKYHISRKDIGIIKISMKEWIGGIVCIVLLYLYIAGKAPRYQIILLSLQTFAVAVSEEIWARGILFYLIKKITSNKIVVLALSSFMFVFLIHANRGIINNLLYRLPGAIIMGIAYEKTGKLYYSILIHYIYNMVAIL